MSDEQTAAERLDLKPMHPIDLRDVTKTSDVLAQMANTAFTGRSLGRAVDTMEAMIQDENCLVVMTLSGAMTMAGLNPLIMEMLERRWVAALVSTGALVGHGMVEDIGLKHYQARTDISDEEYLGHGLNRVYDTIEPESNLDALEFQVRDLLDQLVADYDRPIGTCELLSSLGKLLPGDGVLQLAAKNGVPIFIPAFTDSELGLDLAVHQAIRHAAGKRALAYDGFIDLYRFHQLCQEHVDGDGAMGIFTIGGGVPRNWAQQVGPFVDLYNKRVGANRRSIRYSYGVRVCPDPAHYGHLSGCTYSEGVSWGKLVPVSEGGRYSEVLLDATVAWPLLVQALIDRGN